MLKATGHKAQYQQNKNETRNNFCTPSEVAHIEDRSPLDAQDDIHEKVLLEVLSQKPTVFAANVEAHGETSPQITES